LQQKLILLEKTEKTPDITGRKSSLPAAKIVLLIAVAKTSAALKLQKGLPLTDFEIHHQSIRQSIFTRV
jgi:hypothetical protein